VHWVYNNSRGFVELGDIADSYSVSRGLKTSSSTCLTYPESIHNSQIMWTGKLAHKLFREQPVGVLTHVAQDIKPNSSTSSRGRSPSREVRHFRFDFRDTNHWPGKGHSRRCYVHSSQGKTMVYGCVYPRLRLVHTRLRLHYLVSITVQN